MRTTGQLLSDFHSFLRDAGRSYSTSYNYMLDVKQILPEGCTCFSDVVQAIDDGAAIIAGGSYTPATKRRKTKAAGAFLGFLERQGADVSRAATRVVVVTPRLERVTEEQFAQFLDVIPGKGYLNIRDRAIFQLMWCCGLSVGDALDTRCVYVVKQRQDRIVELHHPGRAPLAIDELTSHALVQYEQAYERRFDRPLLQENFEGAYYFRTNTDGSANNNASHIKRQLLRYSQEAGLNRFCAKTFQDSFAQRQRAQGQQPKRIAQLLNVTVETVRRNTQPIV